MPHQSRTWQDLMTATDPIEVLFGFLLRKQQEGFLSQAEFNEIMRQAAKVTYAAGVPDDPDSAIGKAVEKQALFATEQKLKQVRPELWSQFQQSKARDR